MTFDEPVIPAPKAPLFPAVRRLLSSPLFRIFLAAFLIRLLAVIPSHLDGFGADEKEFLFLAHQMAGGHGFLDSNGEHSVRAPLFPALLTLCVWITGSSLVLPFLLVSFLGALTVIPAFYLARNLWQDVRIATRAAALVAFFPALVLYGSLLMSENLFLPLFLIALLLARRLCSDDRATTHVLFGAVSALAVMTRAVFFGLFPLLVVAVALRRHLTGKPFLRLGLGFCTWCVILAPWTLRNAVIHHAFIPVSTFAGRSLLIGNNPYAHGTTKLDKGFHSWLAGELRERGLAPLDSLSEESVSEAERSIAVSYMVAHPGRVLLLAAEKAYVFWIYPLSHRSDNHPLQAVLMFCDALLWVAVLAGGMLAGMRRLRMFPFWLAMAFFTAMHAFLHSEARYRLPLVPILCIIGSGAAYASDRTVRASLVATAKRRFALLAGALLLAALYAVAFFVAARGAD